MTRRLSKPIKTILALLAITGVIAGVVKIASPFVQIINDLSCCDGQ